MSEMPECSICLEDSSALIYRLPCSHQFHRRCLSRWLGSDVGKSNRNCPLCREKISDRVVRNLRFYPDGLVQYRYDRCYVINT